MNFIRDHWRGRLSVAKSVWLSGIVAFLVCLPIGYLNWHSFLVLNHIGGIDDITARAQDGNLTFAQPPLVLQALDQLFGIISLIWWSVGTWRACDNPDHNRQGAQSRWFLKTTIVLTAAYEFCGLFDFIWTSL